MYCIGDKVKMRFDDIAPKGTVGVIISVGRGGIRKTYQVEVSGKAYRLGEEEITPDCTTVLRICKEEFENILEWHKAETIPLRVQEICSIEGKLNIIKRFQEAE